jgi:hypothetical protein
MKRIAERVQSGIIRVWRSTICKIILGVVIGVSIVFIVDCVNPFLPWKQPIEPDITVTPGPNPIINTGGTQSITITVTPAFEPAYSNYIEVTIPNDNPHKCNMTLKLETSEGFKFLPISDDLPDNFTVEEGYEYKSIMKIHIEGFPPKFSYKEIKFWVYTMDKDTYEGTEDIIFTILALNY